MNRVPSDTEKWEILQAKSQEARVRLAFQAFGRFGLEPIVIKGWAAARDYPPGITRRPGDLDLAIAPEHFAKADNLVRTSDFSPFNIDLHNGLRQLDTVGWNDLFAHSELVPVDGTEIRVLCPEDHLRVLCVHWLLDGGAYRDKLWDIYYAVANRRQDFNWDRCLNVVSQNRRSWVIATIGLAHRFLGLEISDLAFADEARSVPGWVIRCVEREWSKPGRLEPILTSVHDKKLLARQIARRLPPNPIRATVESNGNLFGSLRWWYQGRVIIRRFAPFLRDTIYLVRSYFGKRGR